MSRFTIPRDVYFGEGALANIAKLEGERAMVVTGGASMRKNGFLDRTIKYLKLAGMKVELIEGVEPDPSVDTVLRGAEAMRAFSPDWIVAIGGGSPIDAAKAMWVFYEHPDTRFEQLCIPFNFPELRQKARFCAIPSTSGTATEVTAFSVITDSRAGIKYPLADYNITPDVAIVDAELAMTMPPMLTAHTGMDALTHAIEAYVSTAASSCTDALAEKAISMVVRWLPSSYEGDKIGRVYMHEAQCLAGMAFSNALLGITHSLAHKTGAAFRRGKMAETHLPHGCANAIYLPYVIAYNARDSRALERYAYIARLLMLNGAIPATSGGDDALAAQLRNLIERMNSAMGIPRTLEEYGVDKAEFEERVEDIARNAAEDACTASNPRTTDAKDLRRLLSCIYSGNEVDF